MTRRAAPTLLLAFLAASRMRGQELPFGGEFQINTYTTNSQTTPKLAPLPNGGFVAVWRTFNQTGPTSGPALFGQRYGSTGSKVASEFAVNTNPQSYLSYPDVAGSKDAGFVVVWNGYTPGSKDSFTPPYDVFGQVFDGAGAKVGSEFQVNTDTTRFHEYPAVAMDDGGNFVVVWAGEPMMGRRFDGTGAPIGGEFDVGPAGRPGIAMNGSGEFVIVGIANPGDDSHLFGQRFDATGAKVGPPFPIESETSEFEGNAVVDIDRRGNFVVAWSGGNGTGFHVLAQRFNRAAERVGPEIEVNTFTTGEQTGPDVSLAPEGRFVVAWTSYPQDGSGTGVFAQVFDRSGSKVGPETQVNVFTTGGQGAASATWDGSGFVVAWESSGEDGDGSGIFGRREILTPQRLSVDSKSTPDTSSNTNGVLEPGESVFVEPFWSNDGAFLIHPTGSTPVLFCVLNFPCVRASGSDVDYGPIPPGAIAGCDNGSPTACYRASAGGPRPGTHWDGAFGEFVSSGGGQIWTLHVGDSFSDVPRSQPFYKKIETLLHNGITSGCTETTYCPAQPVTRDQMAIFIAKAIEGSGEYVPTTGMLSGIVFGSNYDCSPGGNSLFIDVAPTDPFCKHVHDLAARNVTLGCGGSKYCPGLVVTRDEMASFIAKGIVAPGGGDAVPLTYGPDPVTGFSYSCDAGSPNLHFRDVPISNVFCKHIHYLWAKGVVDGCGGSLYCPTASVTRDAMAKFIANGFNLQLYGP